MKRKRKELKRTGRRVLAYFCSFLAIYLGISFFFTKHLYLGSRINGINVSGKTVTEVKVQLLAKLQSYTLNIKERGGSNEQITGKDIGLRYNSDEQIENFKEEQNPLTWVSGVVDAKNYEATTGVTFDKELLKQQLDKLSVFNADKIIEPKNAIIKYIDNSYVIQDEVKGNKVDKDILLKSITDAILSQETAIDLESADCYVKPKYTSKYSKLIEARDMLNKYASSKITYTFGDHQETLDGSIINKWLEVDDNFNVNLDEGKVNAYIDSLANTYNTVGKSRSFHTTSGNTVNIGGGDYGWQINKAKEAEALTVAIKGGQTITKQPSYIQSAASFGSSDIGNTYVELDMTKQHLWFYKNGTLIVEGDVVTGNVSLNAATPAGIYRLKYKEKNATLKGQDYNVPVSFWMPFNGNIGIHDAVWRSVFGGQIYKGEGSHGCVNCPYSLAQTIYNNIDAGTPVVCYSS